MSDFNWNNVSNDLEVINLFVEREKIEAKIKALDEFSLVKYEYEKLGLDPANEDIIKTEKALSIQGVSQQRELLPFDFIKWYSGMEETKIRNAYDRWLKEKGNCS